MGTELDDPYSMENVTEAYHALTATIPVGESLPPPPKQTHVYVKFMPKDAKQLEMLTSDPNLEVYDHPVDYTVVKDGHFY